MVARFLSVAIANIQYYTLSPFFEDEGISCSGSARIKDRFFLCLAYAKAFLLAFLLLTFLGCPSDGLGLVFLASPLRGDL